MLVVMYEWCILYDSVVTGLELEFNCVISIVTLFVF